MRLTCNTKYGRHIGSPDSVRKNGEPAVILSGKYLLRNSGYCESAFKGHKLELASFLNKYKHLVWMDQFLKIWDKVPREFQKTPHRLNKDFYADQTCFVILLFRHSARIHNNSQ